MWRYLLCAAALAGFASEVPNALKSYYGTPASQEQPATQPQAMALRTETEQVVAANPLEGRTARIEMDNRGHFVSDVRINGRRMEVLVDTGATAVAINQSKARRLGIQLDASDFKYTVNTANGKIKVATAMLDSIEIGRVRVENVQATVVRDKSLDSILLGMSFLKRLKKFEVSGSTLVLVQ